MHMRCVDPGYCNIKVKAELFKCNLIFKVIVCAIHYYFIVMPSIGS